MPTKKKKKKHHKPPPIPSNVSRVTTSATIDGVDDETFTADEFGHSEGTTQVVLADTLPHNVMHLECRWGDELRVELDLTGQRLDNGDVNVAGVARLFEGTSEDTTDLDGQKNFSILVPKGQTVNNQQKVENTAEGGDYADIRMSFNNAPF